MPSTRVILNLGEAIFTLGYPRDEIVYGEGYLSAKTGYRGDSLTCQIAVAANPGNSGGPVLDKNGEVIGVLSNRQEHVQGAVFAIRSKNIYLALDEMKKDSSLVSKSDSSLTSIHLPQKSTVKNHGPRAADQKNPGVYLPGKKLLGINC